MRTGKHSTSMLALLGAGALVLSACASNDAENEADGSASPSAEQSSSVEASPSAEESSSPASPSASESASSSGSPEASESAESSGEASGGGAAATFGTEEPNLAQAWDVAEQKLKDAESVRIAGTSLSGTAEAGEGSSVDFQLAGTTDDEMSFGTIGMTTDGQAVEFDFRMVDGKTYLKVAKAEGGEMASMQEVLGNRWLLDTENSMGMSDFGVGTMIDQMVSGVASVDEAQMEAVKPEVSTQDGKQVFTYIEPGTDDTQGRDTAVSIDEDGYLTAVEVKDGGGSITFTNWNAVKPIVPPADSMVLDIKNMGG